MKTNQGFILMGPGEFISWLENQQVNRIINVIQNHHTYSPSYKHFNGTNHFERLAAMRDYHVSENGWKDIAQNFTTFPDGTIGTGRHIQVIPAGIKGKNAHGICIEHLGNFDAGNDSMTSAQKETIILINAALCKKFGLKPSIDTIVYHHWFDLVTGELVGGGINTKSCPGTDFFGGNTIDDAKQNFIPLIEDKLREIPEIVPPEHKPVRFYYHITRANLNVRSGPGTNYQKTGVAYKGSVLPVYEVFNPWFKVDLSGSWVSKKFGLFIGEAVINTDSLNVRSGPGTTYPILEKVKKGEKYFIYEVDCEWSKIAINDRWIKNDFIIMSTPIPEET